MTGSFATQAIDKSATDLATDLASKLSQGVTLAIAPHMDDVTLGCGGTLAKTSQHKNTQTNIHVVYATDGARSPVPDSLRAAPPSPELTAIRTAEAQTALGHLGIPPSHLHFLNFPDGALSRHQQGFCEALLPLIQSLKPDYVLLPFRHDCHADHLAVTRFTTNLLRTHSPATEIFEYFIYYRLQLLPKKDIRQYIAPQYLLSAPIQAQATQKHEALQAFKTQTTCFYPWQTRPLLSTELIEEVCNTPELFLKASELEHPNRLFISGGPLIPWLTRLEPTLKRTKSRAILALQTLSRAQ
jgi:N-acetylglucosamine malate deacetylase 1